MTRACTHPKTDRSLLHGYDVVCGRCEQIVGRVVLFPVAVLTPGQASAALNGFEGKAGRDARIVLERVA